MRQFRVLFLGKKHIAICNSYVFDAMAQPSLPNVIQHVRNATHTPPQLSLSRCDKHVTRVFGPVDIDKSAVSTALRFLPTVPTTTQTITPLFTKRTGNTGINPPSTSTVTNPG
ncbi:hypothetical protein SARC_05767 [Sphaeroforma arctica JP610]|uniref:Uncharacterized protein n=1 Tax=Sphaeroforma arctica JP610 TaxID=667725 RepID=A0A0L0G164_9EUKA|nr:hypothetical protein SARC_05767 [Sphaeroforma arctica JP610]KNC81938.1 hypothetical protein SARC_05767 [Sphaeroforma arctica JP610]|eukprot:XP_014155840.1 hypothetical protein SARC_05767 [Sphaeroforma arctica JP610]